MLYNVEASIAPAPITNIVNNNIIIIASTLNFFSIVIYLVVYNIIYVITKINI